MRRMSTVFLLCFVALAVGLGGVIAWKVRARRPPPAADVAPRADYRIREIHISETLGGSLRWTLDAAQAEVFDQEQRTEMRQVAIRLFADRGEWHVTAARGVLDNARRDVALRGDVVVTSSDGLRMTTDTLRWRHQDKQLETRDAVEIRREGTTITGQGLEVRMEEQRAVLGKPVRVTITNRANANLALFPGGGS
jgi:LPS export ABC transporter protein LptC